MTVFIIVSLVISFFLGRNLFAGVATGWIAYAIVSTFAPEYAMVVGIAIALLGAFSSS